MSEVEKEILKLTNFKNKKEYDNRQDYLAAIARAVDSMGNDDFDSMSNAAADWFNAAAEALNNKEILPDFDGVIEDKKPETEVEETEGEEAPEEEAPKPKAKTKEKKKAPKETRELKYTPVVDIKTLPELIFNEYGVAKGTKNYAAIEMLEAGCKMKDITGAIGGTYYNLIARLVREGHVLKKDGSGILTLTHKDRKVSTKLKGA